MKALVCALLCAAVAMGAAGRRYSYTPYNSRYVFEDSVFIDSTVTVTMPIFWQDNGEQKFILLEARDDSSTGFASDSFSVKIEARQVFPLNNRIGDYNSFPYAVDLASKAHPDSTGYPYSSDFILFDSLDILDMDTACVYARNLIPATNSAGDTVDWVHGDTLLTLQTSGFGAFEYVAVPFDYSPGLTLKITGLLRNLKRGTGSFLRVRIGQLMGTNVKAK